MASSRTTPLRTSAYLIGWPACLGGGHGAELSRAALGIDDGIPDLQRLPPGDTMRVFQSSATHWGIDEYDLANQGLISHHFELVDERFELISVPFRYTWPAELDLMAQLAGMRLRERWSGWQREPFTSDSRKHVSVWEKPAAA